MAIPALAAIRGALKEKERQRKREKILDARNLFGHADPTPREASRGMINQRKTVSTC